MSIYINGLVTAIKSLEQTYSEMYQAIRDMDMSEVAGFKKRMETEPSLEEFMPPFNINVSKNEKKRLQKKARIEFEAAHLLWENYHAYSQVLDNPWDKYPPEIRAMIETKRNSLQELMALQEDIKQKKELLRVAEIKERLAIAWNKEQVLIPFVENTIPKMLKKYTSLGRHFDNAIELYHEGGHVFAIGYEKLNDFQREYHSFMRDVLQLKITISSNQTGVNKEFWQSESLERLVSQFDLLVANASALWKSFDKPLEAIAESGVEWIVQDLYGTAARGSIFNALVNQELLSLFIDETLKGEALENAKNNLLDRIKFCWKNKIDVFLTEGLHEGQKLDALAGIKDDKFEFVDFCFDKAIYNKLHEELDKLDLTTSLDIIEQTQRAKIAGNVYRPIPTLTFQEGQEEPYINETFGVRSIVEKIAPNLLLKVDKEGEVPGMEWIGNSTAKYMNYSLLMSAGGGRVFANKAGLIALATLSNSAVDAKAYSMSVAGSSCVEDKSVTSAIGTMIWVYVDKNGDPIVADDGRIRGKKNSNEGSSWNSWGGSLPYQERTVAEEWISYLKEVNKVQAKFSIDFQNKVRQLKQAIRISCTVRSMWERPKDIKFFGKLSKLNDVTGIQFIDIPAKEKASVCGGKTFSFKDLEIHTAKSGKKYIKLPYVGSREATIKIIESLPMFTMALEGKSTVSAKVTEARWGLTTAMLLVELDDMTANENWKYDWLDHFTNGVDPMIKSHCSKYKCEWNWKSLALRRRNIDANFNKQMKSFATLSRNGKTIIDVRREMEDRVEWPSFEGLKSLWGFVPEVAQKVLDEIEFVKIQRVNKNWKKQKKKLLKKFPRLVAQRLEEAVELPTFNPEVWNNTLATGIIGKGKSLPIDLHRVFVPWNDGISATNLRGEVSEAEMAEWLKVSFVKNKDDGADKSKAYKGFLSEVGEKELASKFDLDPEHSALPGQKMVPVGYMFGSPMKVRVAVMRRMKLGKVGATFQATEKKPTTLHGSGLAGEATKLSTLAYREYLGIVPIGGEMDRKDLPQIPAKRRVEFLNSLGVEYVECVAKTEDLLPLQKYISDTKSKSKKSVLVSSDGYIVDGHHRWYACSDEYIDIIYVDMAKDELLKRALAFEGSYIAKPSRFELIKQFFNTVAKLPMQTADGSELSEFQFELAADDLFLPGKLYVNMMEALCRIESAEVFKRINENIATSLDGELLKVYEAMGCTINDSAKLSCKQIDSINAKLSDFVRGAVIKAVNIPVHVFDAIEAGAVILPPKMRTKSYDGRLSLIFRYPIASATSVGIVKVYFGDDPEVKGLLESYGINFAEYPDVMFISSGDKKNYQYDDDGDCFGVLVEPNFNLDDWKLTIARALNEFEGKFNKHAVREDGSINTRKYSKKLWKTVRSWTAISMNLLERSDYDQQNIEMSDIKTENNKKSMRIMDLRGYCTEEFRKLSHQDARGPVGLISDLFTVILASGAKGEEFTRLACICGYILQHSIDSAKKEKLVIPAAILLCSVVWIEVESKLELKPEVNELVQAWNEAWSRMDKSEIVKIENKANTLYQDSNANYIQWLPTIDKIVASAAMDDQVLFYAPSTLLANMAQFAVKGKYGTYEIFGQKVPVHPKLVDAVDPTRYIAAHTLEIHQFTDKDGKIVPWKAFSAFRKINVKDNCHFVAKSQHEGVDENNKDKWSNWIEWLERTDENNFPAYFKDVFEGEIWESYPNLVYKFVLRWAVELCWNGKDKLKEYSKKFNEKNRIEKDQFVLPNFPWSISKSKVLLPEKSKTVVELKNGEYNFIVDEKLGDELTKFFTASVLYYKDKGTSKYSVSLWKLIVDWVETPMSMKDVVADERFDRNEFYLSYTRLMRQVGLLLLAKLQYSEVPQDGLEYIKSLSKTSSEFLQLTKYTLGETVYEYTPNPIGVRIASIVNTRYEDAITKNGRDPEARWQPSFINYTKSKKYKGKTLSNYQLKPHWYVGTDAEWSDEMKANVTDLVVQSLTRHIEVFACELTQPLLEELSSIENLHEYIKDETSKVNPFTKALIQHNKKHFAITGISYTDCECCQSHIRKLTTKTAREEVIEPGTERHREKVARKANVYVAKELIQAIKAQCEVLVTKAIESDDFNFENNAYGLETETILQYVESFGSDLVKSKFGLPLYSDYLIFQDWDKLWQNLDKVMKGLFVDLISKELDIVWWDAPMGYLLNNLEAFMISKKLIRPDDEKEPVKWMSLTEWEGQNPTPPPSGGGGGSFKYTLLSEKDCTKGETPLAKVQKASQEIKRLKSEGTFVKTDLSDARLVIIWAAKDNSSFIEESIQKVGTRSYIVLNKPEHVQKLLKWTETL
tara:strand:+ start:3847 stop:10806 length:6960 start_codon:yes stop_codon:yes gene_type:complete